MIHESDTRMPQVFFPPKEMFDEPFASPVLLPQFLEARCDLEFWCIGIVQPESRDERGTRNSGLLVGMSAKMEVFGRSGTVWYCTLHTVPRYVPKIRAGNDTAISPSLGDHQQLPITLLWAYFLL